jgi:RNA-directed DNA polymerase
MSSPSYSAKMQRHELPEPRSAPWPQPVDGTGLARALGVAADSLWYHVTHTSECYAKHTIPKKSGGVRTLHVPREQLLWQQRAALEVFFDRLEWPEHVSAYVPGRSVLDAAKQHARPAVLVVLDIQDFFPSTRRSWVRDALGETFGLGVEATEALATLVTAPWDLRARTRWCVPQGAATSGAVANLVALKRLDPHLLALSKEHGLVYTRYADDLAFSRQTAMPAEETHAVIQKVINAIRRAGYRVNYDKIRVQRRNRQQRLLGLTINETPNIPRKEYKKMRAMAHRHRCDRLTPEEQSRFEGLISYVHAVRPDKAARLRGAA